jgi:hypothetical protein
MSQYADHLLRASGPGLPCLAFRAEAPIICALLRSILCCGCSATTCTMLALKLLWAQWAVTIPACFILDKRPFRHCPSPACVRGRSWTLNLRLLPFAPAHMVSLGAVVRKEEVRGGPTRPSTKVRFSAHMHATLKEYPER